jgi:hypothetical protein
MGGLISAQKQILTQQLYAPFGCKSVTDTRPFRPVAFSWANDWYAMTTAIGTRNILNDCFLRSRLTTLKHIDL